MSGPGPTTAKHHSYHIQHFPPVGAWPVGGYSVYAISGDQIAERIVRDQGKVVRRDSWPGFLGTAATFEGVAEMISKHEAGTLERAS